MINNSLFTYNKLYESQGYSSAPCLFSDSINDFLNISNTFFLNNTSEFLETCLFYRGYQLSIVAFLTI